MAKLFKANRTYPLPKDADIVTRKGERFIRIVEQSKPIFYPLTEDGERFLKPRSKWCAEVQHADGSRKRVYFSTRKDASEMMLAELLKNIELQKVGVVDRFATQRKRPIAEHVKDWSASLKASGREEGYIKKRVNRVLTLVQECNFTFVADIQADAVEQFLYDLREVDGLSIQTANDWLAAFRQLIRWMVSNQRLDHDPLTRLKAGNVRLDVRHRRGELSADEVTELLDATQRGSAYRVSIRRSQPCHDLQGGSGDRVPVVRTRQLDAEAFQSRSRATPIIVLHAGDSKNRRGATQPIAQWLADELKTYIVGRTVDQRQAMAGFTWSEKWCGDAFPRPRSRGRSPRSRFA